MRLSVLLPLFIIALLSGLGFTFYTQATQMRFGKIDIGEWSTWPVHNIKETDPYTAALVAHNGDMPLGQGEGVSFIRKRDDDHQKLNPMCHYQLKGAFPIARMWTITLTTLEGIPIANSSNRYGFTSRDILYSPEGAVVIDIAPFPTGGNWLPIGKSNAFQIIFNLYDTPLNSTSKALTPTQLPRLHKVRCL